MIHWFGRVENRQIYFETDMCHLWSAGSAVSAREDVVKESQNLPCRVFHGAGCFCLSGNEMKVINTNPPTVYAGS